MIEEAITQLPRGVFPTHVFVQGGVGGLAAAVCGLTKNSVARAQLTSIEQ
ncbi:hypothetical protein [Bradyrhizobium sp. 179]|nr:hypothetical protein [Bradyrhizobium sp. 179]